MESYGEDPTLIAKLGSAYVTGIQHGDVGAPHTAVLLTAASPKHFADYNLECTCYKGVRSADCNPDSPAGYNLTNGCKPPHGIGRNAYAFF